MSTKDPFIGKQAGKCVIEELIGEGGTAYVYRAHNEAFKMDRVIKILKREFSADEDYYPRFKQEAQLVARLDHPNILRVFDTGMFENHIYIEMEYIKGVTLREYMMRHGRLPEKTILNMALQIVGALRFAHELELSTPEGVRVRGILHRDIKPENIMITPNKEVKLMDFGAAEVLTVAAAAESGGKIFGTLAYMSPEQISGYKLDVRSDFFALGTVIYEMFTGQKAFPAEGLHELMEQVKTGKYQPVRKLRRSISPLTEELLDKLLSSRPSRRPNDAAEIEEDLKICQQFYSIYGTGARIKVPISWRKYFSEISLGMSFVALVLSLFAIFGKNPNISLLNYSGESAEAQVMIHQAKLLEQKNKISAAIEEYLKVPEGTKEYVEAQTHAASLYYSRLKQLSKARSILESLRTKGVNDPYVDAILGLIYYQMALYPEARQRLDASLESNKTPVLEIDDQFKDDIQYFLSMAWDREYRHINKDPKVLEKALKAWSYYLDVSCESGKNLKSSRCQHAQKRKNALAKSLL
ncbi:MAG: serine/threonine protein kinase [Fibrobacter sp.]|nr:serine/threonine protein kinase [Fibrobacter sp.]